MKVRGTTPTKKISTQKLFRQIKNKKFRHKIVSANKNINALMKVFYIQHEFSPT
jgi:hypothetical protein